MESIKGFEDHKLQIKITGFLFAITQELECNIFTREELKLMFIAAGVSKDGYPALLEYCLDKGWIIQIEGNIFVVLQNNPN